MSTLVQRAQEIRARLMNPPNAVPDLGIDLKRKPEPPPAIVEAEPEQSPSIPTLPNELTLIEAEIRVLNARLDALNERYAIVAKVRRPSIREIQDAVCIFYAIPYVELISNRRTAAIVRPRQIGMYLSKTLTLRSLPEVGRHFGGRDHTTVLHAVRKIGSLMNDDPHFRCDINKIIAAVSEKTGIVINS